MAGFVLAVSGPPGSGKTTLLGELAQRLAPVAVHEFDRYEQMTRLRPAEIEAWMARGGNPDEMPLGDFAVDLARHKSDAARAGGRGLVLADTLFGRAHAASGALIDALVWLDTPLDVALGRSLDKLARMALADPRPDAARGFVAWLTDWLPHYTGFIRRTYELQRERVRPGADLVVDGTLTPSAIADAVVARYG